MRLSLDKRFYANLFTHDLAQRRLNRYLLHSADEIRAYFLIHGVLQEGVPTNGISILPAINLQHIGFVKGLEGGFDPALPPGAIPSSFAKPYTFTNEFLLAYMTQMVPQVVQLMTEFPGQVFIAGGSLYSIFRSGHIGHGGDIDIFICAESTEEAEMILSRGMSLFPEANPKDTWRFLEASPMVCSTYAVHQDANGGRRFITVQFVRRLYPKGRPDMIVGAFDLHPCQIFWSIGTGIQCTTTALVSMLTQSFPLDLSRRSYSFGNRLLKYLNVKCCNLILPGVNVEDPITEFGWKKCRQGDKECFVKAAGDSMEYRFEIRSSNEADYVAPEQKDSDEETEEKPLCKRYEPAENEDPSFYRNLSVILREGQNVVFKLKSYEDFCSDKLDLCTALFKDVMQFKKVVRRGAESISSMFKHEEDYKEFALALYVDKKKKLAKKLWEANVEKLLAYLRPLFCGGKPPSFYWKVDNPGAQSFGQNFPRPIAPEEYYGGPEYYSRLRVGLPDVAYWTLKELSKMYGMPRDVFRLLCHWTLQAEGWSAFQKLNLA